MHRDAADDRRRLRRVEHPQLTQQREIRFDLRAHRGAQPRAFVGAARLEINDVDRVTGVGEHMANPAAHAPGAKRNDSRHLPVSAGARPWGAVKSTIGPSGTMPLGFRLRWLS